MFLVSNCGKDFLGKICDRVIQRLYSLVGIEKFFEINELKNEEISLEINTWNLRPNTPHYSTPHNNTPFTLKHFTEEHEKTLASRL